MKKGMVIVASDGSNITVNQVLNSSVQTKKAPPVFHQLNLMVALIIRKIII